MKKKTYIAPDMSSFRIFTERLLGTGSITGNDDNATVTPDSEEEYEGDDWNSRRQDRRPWSDDEEQDEGYGYHGF